MKNYIFDLGGVILDINLQNALDGFRALGVPEGELRFDKGETAELMRDYQLGLVSTEKFCESIADRCAASHAQHSAPSLNQVASAWNSVCLGVPQNKLDALRVLKKRANVYLLSNTNELHWQYCLDRWFNANGNRCEDFFDRVFLSQELHLEKPNPEIFRVVLHELKIEPDSEELAQTVFLDDNRDNADAASGYGISAIHVTPGTDWLKLVSPLD